MNRRTLRAFQLALALGLVSAGPPPAAAEPVLTFGDDLVFEGSDALSTALAAAGIEAGVSNFGAANATAELYAGPSLDTLPAVVGSEPGVEVVYLSLGANDLFSLYGMGLGVQAADEIQSDLRTIVDNLFARAPDIPVVVTGYPYSNFTSTSTCQQRAAQIFGPMWTQLTINRAFTQAIDSTLLALDQTYPNVTFVPFAPVLQESAGQVADVTAPSPDGLIRNCSDPTDEGYRLLMERLVARYWLARPRPAVTLMPPAPRSYCPGEQVTLTAVATNAERRSWAVNGMVSNQTSATFQARIPEGVRGDILVRVTAFNGPWRATDTATVSVRLCADAAVETDDAGQADGGDGGLDTGSSDASLEFDGGERPIAPVIDGGCTGVGGDAAGAPFVVGLGLLVAGWRTLRSGRSPAPRRPRQPRTMRS